jgi:hypothetical protein
MHALPGSRIELSETLDKSEQPLYGGTFDGTHYDSQNWEEMTSLLSFDGEEHKYVMRWVKARRAVLTTWQEVQDIYARWQQQLLAGWWPGQHACYLQGCAKYISPWCVISFVFCAFAL